MYKTIITINTDPAALFAGADMTGVDEEATIKEYNKQVYNEVHNAFPDATIEMTVGPKIRPIEAMQWDEETGERDEDNENEIEGYVQELTGQVFESGMFWEMSNF